MVFNWDCVRTNNHCNDAIMRGLKTWHRSPFNSHLWPRQNFSSQYHYNIKQMSDENIEKYKLGFYWLIQYQILRTNIIIIVWQAVRRILNTILGVKGLTIKSIIQTLTASTNCLLRVWYLALEGFSKPLSKFSFNIVILPFMKILALSKE